MKTAEKVKYEGGVLSALGAVGDALSVVMANPLMTASVASVGLDIKKALENGASEEQMKDPNFLASHKLVSEIIADPGLFRLLALQRARIGMFLDQNQNFLIGAAADIINDDKSSLTITTKLNLLTKLLNNETALGEINSIVQHIVPQLENIVHNQKVQTDILQPRNIKISADELEALMPELGKIFPSIVAQRENILALVQLATPLILSQKDALGKDIPLDMKKLLPVIEKMLFAENGLAQPLNELLTGKAPMLYKIINNNSQLISDLLKPYGASEELQKSAVALLPKLMPVINTVLAMKGEEIAPIFSQLQTIMDKKTIAFADVTPLLSSVQKMLMDKQILNQLVNVVQDPNLVKVASEAVKMPMVQTILKTALKTEQEVVLNENTIKNAVDFIGLALKNKNILGLMDDVLAVNPDKPTTIYGALPSVFDLLKDQEITSSLKAVLNVKGISNLLPMVLPLVGENINDLVMKNNLLSAANIEMADAFVNSAVNAVPVWADAFSNPKAMDIIYKILRKMENDREGVIQNNDLSGAEILTLAQAAISGLEKADFASTVQNNKDALNNLLPAFAPLIPQQLVSADLMQKLAPAVTDGLGVFMSTDNLAIIKNEVLPHLPNIMEQEGKAQVTAIFAAGDAMMRMIKSKESTELYARIQPIIIANQAELGEMVDKIKNQMPAMRPFAKIKGEQIVSLLAEPETLGHLEKIYNHVKEESYLKAAFAGMKAMASSDNLKAVALLALATLIVEALRAIFVPTFIKRNMVNDHVKGAIDQGLKGEGPHDMAKVFDQVVAENKDLKGAGKRALNNHDCSDLIITANLSNCVIKHFNFKNATLGLDLQNSKFVDCNLSGVKFKGEGEINLSNAKFDMKSFKTMLPSLEKMEKNGKKVNVTGMLITNLQQKDIEDLKETKFWKAHGAELENNYKTQMKHSARVEAQKGTTKEMEMSK